MSIITSLPSRFLLNGFNLPADFFGPNDPTADEGLYVSTGQQYTFSDSSLPSGSDTPTEYRVTLQMGDVAESFISFPENPSDGKPHIVYSIPNTTNITHPLLKLVNDLNGLTDTNIATANT